MRGDTETSEALKRVNGFTFTRSGGGGVVISQTKFSERAAEGIWKICVCVGGERGVIQASQKTAQDRGYILVARRREEGEKRMR